MQRKNPTLFEMWRSFDDLSKDFILYLAHLPVPVSIDTLVSLSQASVMTTLNTIQRLKAKRVVMEKKGKERGLYFLNDPDPAGFVREHVSRGEANRALSRIIDSYQGSADNIEDSEIVKVAELYQKIGSTGKGLDIVKKAADILARSGQDEKAVRCYDYCVRSMPDQSVGLGNVEDFLDSVLGGVSILIYHMSAQDELSLLGRAKDVAIRFKKWDRLAKIEIVTAQVLQTLGEHRKAFRCFNSFRKLVSKAEDPKMMKSAVLTTCEFLFWKGMFSEVVNHYERVIGSLEEFGDDEASLKAAALVGYCFVICGRVARGMGMIETVRAKGRLLGLQQVVIFAEQMTILSLFEIRKISEAETVLR